MRPDWETYFLRIVSLVAKRSTCLKGQYGAVIVKDRRVLTTGYNGSPRGLDHCSVTGCVRDQCEDGDAEENCRGVEAAQNAVVQAALFGINIEDATVYTNKPPDVTSAKMLINAGVKDIVILGVPPKDLAKELLDESRVRVVVKR